MAKWQLSVLALFLSVACNKPGNPGSPAAGARSSAPSSSAAALPSATGRSQAASSAAALKAAHVPRTTSGAPARLERTSVPRRRAARQVVLLSIDGLAPYVMAKAKTPTLDRLSQEGTSFTNAETVRPSVTLTSHASMISGVEPSVHGVNWNYYDPRREFRTPTVFTHCKRQGLLCAMFAGKDKFAHFSEKEEGVARYEFHQGAGRVLAAATAYFNRFHPDFLFVHLAEVDGVGHGVGWDTPEQIQVIEGIDRLVAHFHKRLQAGADKPLSWVITADHGGHGNHHQQGTPQDMAIPWIAYGDRLPKLGLTQAQSKVSTMDSAATAMDLLGLDIPVDWAGRSHALRSPLPNPSASSQAVPAARSK